MTWRPTLVVVLAGAGCFCGADVHAQSTSEPAPGRFELGAGSLWSGAVSFGSRDATLTTPTGGSFRLFSTSSELAQATGVELRFGTRITRLIQAEVVGSYTAPQLSTAITSDVESAGSTTASDQVEQLVVEGAVTVDVARWRPGPRLAPFLGGGAGYVRQLHQEKTLVQTGRTYHVGGGVKFSLVSRGTRSRLKQIGIRAEGRAYVRTGGVTLDGRAHAAPAVSAALFARF